MLNLQSPYTFIDLTYPITAEIPTWSGGCGFQSYINIDYQQCTNQAQFRVQSLKLEAGLGTHMDSPAHCIPGGRTIGDLTPEEFVSPCVKIDISNRADATYRASLKDLKLFEQEHGVIAPGSFVIFYTGWDKHWYAPAAYRNNLVFPTIEPEVAIALLDRNIAGLGIDTLSPDMPNGEYPVHKLILGADKYIIENVANASKMPALGGYVLAFPLNLPGLTESPIRMIGAAPKSRQQIKRAT